MMQNSPEERQKVLKDIKNTDPLHYHNMIANMSLRLINENSLLLYGSKEFAIEFYTKLHKLLNDDDLIMLKVDKDIVNTLLDTDNKLFYRQLFTPYIFLNTEFEFDNKIIKGLCIIDNIQWLSIMMVWVDSQDMSENHLIFKIADDTKESDEQFTPKELKYINKLRHIICNVLDLIEDDGLVDKVTIVKDTKTNEKRLSKGKHKIPTKIVIKPKTELKIYIDKYNNNRDSLHYTHKFLVRGHWRHFNSDSYTIEKRGTKKWIKPFYKGQGPLIKKTYEVRK